MASEAHGLPQQQTSSWRHNRKALYAAAVAALVLAAVVVAVAVPVSAARSSAAADASERSAARQLEALQAAPATPASRAAANRAAARARREAGQQQSAADACQGVAGLCKVPVRLVTFPGTHNSNALKTTLPNLAEHQKLTFAEQLQAGARLFDLDYAGGRNGARFGHCLSCFCVFSEVDSENDPAKVFKAMADFLAANPREVIVIGLSNIQCGDKDVARQQLLGLLAASPLLNYVSLQPIGPNTLMGELVARNQRAIFLFYDEWVTPTGHKVGGKFVPNQALWRIYGGGASVDGQDPATIDNQVAQGLLSDVVKQISAPQPALSPNTPWRIMGLFPSSCLVCRAAGVCGPISCAEKANGESFVLYILGKATSRWTRSRGADQSQLVPAFNGFQIDYLQQPPRSNVVSAAQRLNRAIAWMYTARPGQAGQLGLGNCVWVLDDAAAAGGLACVADAGVKVQSLLGLPAGAGAGAAAGGRRLQQQQEGGGGGKRHLFVPANPALTVRIFANGQMRKEVKGSAGEAQVLDLSTTATDLQVSWA